MYRGHTTSPGVKSERSHLATHRPDCVLRVPLTDYCVVELVRSGNLALTRTMIEIMATSQTVLINYLTPDTAYSESDMLRFDMDKVCATVNHDEIRYKLGLHFAGLVLHVVASRVNRLHWHFLSTLSPDPSDYASACDVLVPSFLALVTPLQSQLSPPHLTVLHVELPLLYRVSALLQTPPQLFGN